MSLRANAIPPKQSRRRLIADELAKVAAAEEMEPLEYTASQLHAGRDLSPVAKDLGFTREAVSTFVNCLSGGKETLEASRSEGAHALVDEAMVLLKNCPPDREEIALCKEKVALLLWKAARLNRGEFGAEAKTSVNVLIENNRAGFLDALRVRIVQPDRPAQLSAGGIIVDAQIEQE